MVLPGKTNEVGAFGQLKFEVPTADPGHSTHDAIGQARPLACARLQGERSGEYLDKSPP